MKILVVGGGGREHALAWKLSQEAEVICAPGNPGIADDVETVAVVASDTSGLVALAKDRGVDLVVVGPEDPLINGLGDALREARISVYGPGSAGARLEGSKAFSKEAMVEAGIPTAVHKTFRDAMAALDYARSIYGGGGQLAVKASGAALGKGVVVAETLETAIEAIESMMVRREFGAAGDEVVLEERLIGREFSLLTIVGPGGIASLPVAQDHKRAFDNDKGPNTGGMGTFSPCEWVSQALIEESEQRMVVPLLEHLRQQGIEYRGTLFTGVMVQAGIPYCLEYNVRFGDPETQTVMMRTGAGLARALLAAATGSPIDLPEVLPNAALTVVVASGGYPGTIQKGLPISIGALPEGAKIFHAGTARDADGRLVTSGGRVFGVSAQAPTLQEAKDIAYRAVGSVQFEGAFSRSDIGAPAE